MSRDGMKFMALSSLSVGGGNCMENDEQAKEDYCGHFQMPVHYPRYRRPEYESMPEWKINCLLAQYGLPVSGDVNQKRKFAMGAFLWSC